jgi:hypothetical protein
MKPKTPKGPEPIAFVAALAERGVCFGTDADGEWCLKLILPANEGAALAQRIDELRGLSFAVVCQPMKS